MTNPKDIFNKAIKLIDKNIEENSNVDYYELIHLEKYNEFNLASKDNSIYQEAIGLLTEYIILIPNCKYAYLYLGVLYHQIKQFENGIIHFQKAIAIDEVYYHTHYKFGELNLDLKNFKDAAENFTNAIKFNPNCIISYFNRAYAYINLKKYAEAITDFTQYISKGTNNYKAYQKRGICFLLLKKYDDAIEDFTKVIVIDQNNASMYINRGLCYLESSDYENAIKDFNKNIELEKTDVHVLKFLKEAKLKLEDSSKPNRKPGIIQAICDMNIFALEELLVDFRTYNNATKTVFLSKMKQAFDFFKDQNEIQLIPHAGICKRQSYCRSQGGKGFAFVGKNSKTALNLIFIESSNNFEDITSCNCFTIDDTNIKIFLDYRIDIKIDERSKYYPSPDNSEMLTNCKLAYCEIINPSIDILTADTITKWLTKYSSLHSTIGINAGLYASSFNFSNLFRLLQKIEKHISFENSFKEALLELNKISNLDNIAKKNWLLKYESFEEQIAKLEVAFKDNGEIDYNTFSKKYNTNFKIKLDSNEIKYGLLFCKTFNDYYFEIARKYKIFTDEEFEMIDKSLQSNYYGTDLMYQIRKDRLEKIN